MSDPLQYEFGAPTEPTGAAPVAGGSPYVSVLDPNYRPPRAPLGFQELGGLVGSIFGGIAGTAVGGPFLTIPGSIAGAGIGGGLGEAAAQTTDVSPTTGEPLPMSMPAIGKAAAEEAAWDAAGNLVLKVAGKVIRLGKDMLGFSSKEVPDANKAANDFLTQYGSSLPMSARTGSGFDAAIEGLVNTPMAADLFKSKSLEIKQALETGNAAVLKSLADSPEFEKALRSNVSPQRASGQVLQNFIGEGEKSLSAAVDPIYKSIFADKTPTISLFDPKTWAQRTLETKKGELTSAQRSILEEIKNLPPTVNVEQLHGIRSRWLAENRDKYSGAMSSSKDSRASATISDLISKFDNAMDASAVSVLDKAKLAEYKKVTKTYREGIQGLQTDAVQAAMSKNPEDVGAYLFQAGNETPILNLYKSAATAGNLNKTSSKEVIDALRYGYLEALTTTPENILKFAGDLKNSNTRNTFEQLFKGTPQYDAIKAMTEAAEKGLVMPKALPGMQYQAAAAGKQVGGGALAFGTGYAFLLSPEQQQRIKDNLGTAAVSGGALFLTQRKLAKLMLDPKGAKAITYLSSAKDKLTSPSAFTKLVVEPMVNVLGIGEEQTPLFSSPSRTIDATTFNFGNQ